MRHGIQEVDGAITSDFPYLGAVRPGRCQRCCWLSPLLLARPCHAWWRPSPSCWLCMRMTWGTGVQLQALREWLVGYCKDHPAEWAQSPNVFVEGVGAGDDGTISIMLWMRFLRPPSQGLRFAAARTELWMALSDKFKAWDFHFARPTLPIASVSAQLSPSAVGLGDGAVGGEIEAPHR